MYLLILIMQETRQA